MCICDVQMVSARRSAAQSCQPPPPLVCLEINEVGIKMSERTQVKYGGDMYIHWIVSLIAVML